jgi:hypothetical protein
LIIRVEFSYISLGAYFPVAMDEEETPKSEADTSQEYYYSDDDGAGETDADGDIDLSEAEPGSISVGPSGDAATGPGAATASAGAGPGHSRGRSSRATSSTKPLQDYALIKPEELAAAQRKIIHEVATVLSVPSDVANLLLIHFK